MLKAFISRTLKKNSSFQEKLSKVGIEVIGQSLVHFSPTPLPAIPETDWIFFYSKNGVKFFFQSKKTKAFLKDLATGKRAVKWAAFGKGTATALNQLNIAPDFIGNGHPTTTAEAFLKVAKGQKVLFARAKISKKSVQQLVAGKIKIADIIVYENITKKDFALPYCNFLVFTSPLNAKAYFGKMILQSEQEIIAIGNTTAQALYELGFPKVIIAKNPTEKALAEAVLSSSKHKNLTLPRPPSTSLPVWVHHQPSYMRYAVIDLGTNTFHLLVAEKLENGSFKELHRQRFFVKLAEEGIEIELIDGNREAELIYKGVILAVPFQEKNYLLMDIGGGSVEFIIANKNQILWVQSFPIGVAVLYKKFHHAEPITPIEIETLHHFLETILTPLLAALKQFPATILVGASGTFDVLEYTLAKGQKKGHYASIALEDFPPLYNLLIQSTKEERFAMQDVPDTRADMIVVAVILIDFILRKASLSEIIVSNFAMKEGILSEMMA